MCEWSNEQVMALRRHDLVEAGPTRLERPQHRGHQKKRGITGKLTGLLTYLSIGRGKADIGLVGLVWNGVGGTKQST